MRTEIGFAGPILAGFLLTLARVAGALTFVQLPGIARAPRQARLVLAVALTLLLAPAWPRIEALPTGGQMAQWLLAEAAFGIAAGVVVALLGELFLIACQTVGLQAGFSYALTIDPTSQADSGVLQVFGQLAASLLFFACGIDRQVLRAFALSLERFPPGAFHVTPELADAVIQLGSGMFNLGLRLALPALALLMLVDLSLALVGRINAQLQLLSIAFPAKMLAALATLAIMTALLPALYEQGAGRAVTVLAGLARGR
jgi:flagellar biosynthetic protein FliR